MKTITNTLLIAAIFTSNIVASQPCTGTHCFATFGKPVAYKVATSFKQNSISTEEQIHNNNIIEQQLFHDNIVSDDEIIEVVEIEITDNAPVTEVFEDFTPTEEYSFENREINPIVINNTTVEDLVIETLTMEEDTKDTKLSINIDLETICKENQELVSCDTTNESTECVCA